MISVNGKGRQRQKRVMLTEISRLDAEYLTENDPKWVRAENQDWCLSDQRTPRRSVRTPPGSAQRLPQYSSYFTSCG